MPSAQDCAERLREQAYKTLLPQIRDLEEELQNISGSLSTGIRQIGQRLEALRHIELPITEPVIGEMLDEAVRRKDLEANALVLFGRGLRRKETQEEILTLLLDAAQRFSPRIALFAVRGDRFIGWSSRGYSESLAGNVGSCSFPRSECPQFQNAFESEDPTAVSDLPDGNPLQFLQEDAAKLWRIFPLRVLQRPVAVMLAAGAEGNSDALSILMELTAQRLENIALKILYELTAASPAPMPQAMPAEPIAAAMPVAAPEPVAAPPAREAFEEAQASEPIPVVPRFEMESPQELPTPVEAASIAAAEQGSAVQAEEYVEAPIPMPQPEPSKAQPPETRPMPEEEKLHSDAKRFARLLVSEIKLYNEHHVVEGRENHDLYLRLKRDIDRSREMYEKRVSPSVSRKIDYFHDEIIRILGDNDPSTLGSDYPGPRVES
jgi:hypothetical protein